MKMKEYEKIEALLSAMEDEKLRLHENAALSEYFEQWGDKWEMNLQGSGRERLFYWINELIIRWKTWLMVSSNASTHNLIFYQDRLTEVLEK